MSVGDEELDSLDVFNQGSEDVFLDSLEPTILKEKCDVTPARLTAVS